ncbi:MAG: glycosyltransferase [Proteobacteria bacterium]|nr:glycosyltransferase [Pseudomonadota bacterium]
MTHVVLYVPSLSAGGAERVALNLAEALPSADLRATLLVNQLTGPLAASVPPSVRVVSLDATRTLAALPGLARFLRRERPDVTIAFLSFNNLIAILANFLALRPTRVVASQHIALSQEASRSSSLKDRLVPALYRLALPSADHVVTVSQGVADDLASVLPRRAGVSVIHNPIVSPRLQQEAMAPLDHPWFAGDGVPLILAVGRMVPQKNFPLLIDAFAHLRRTRRARLAILGEGPLRQDLGARIAALGLKDDATLLMPDPNPWRYMARAAAVVLSSDFEGFGNVLVEAMATGVPVVSTDCPYGPAEILEGGRWGPLIKSPTPERLAEAICHVLDHPVPAEKLRARAMDFSSAKVAQSYRALIRRLCDSPGPALPALEGAGANRPG